MKFILVGSIIILVIFTVFLIYQGKLSQTGTAPGLSNAKLAACPTSPNCICTEFSSDIRHYMPPLYLPQFEASTALARGSDIITAMGGHITLATNDYLSATFSSNLFHFVDDFELHWEAESQTLHIRSASRAGYSDMGMNKKRVSQFMDEWQK